MKFRIGAQHPFLGYIYIESHFRIHIFVNPPSLPTLFVRPHSLGTYFLYIHLFAFAILHLRKWVSVTRSLWCLQLPGVYSYFMANKTLSCTVYTHLDNTRPHATRRHLAKCLLQKRTTRVASPSNQQKSSRCRFPSQHI